MDLKDAKMYALVHNGSKCGCESIYRLVQKHEVEADWNKAVNFIPKAGELIVYDVDDEHNYPRLKVGDGKTLVMNLPFFSEDAVGDLYNKLDKETQDRITAIQAAIEAAADDAAAKAKFAEDNANIYTDVKVTQERNRAEAVESNLTKELLRRIPAGGRKGQNLTKKSDSDFDTYWADPDDINSIEHITLNGEDVPVEDKTANIKVDPKTIGFESTNVAYTDKENTFTEPQTFSYVHSDDPNWSEYGELGGSSANYSYTEYTDDTHKYSTSGEAYISSFVGRVMVGRSTIDEKGVSKNSIVLDVRKNWIARTELTRERIDGELGTPVQTYYAYKFPKTHPNKEVTLATIEDLDSAITDLDKEHIAYVNKENTFTERQRIVTPYDSDINTQEEGFIDAGIINVSRIKYTDDTKQYYTDNDAILNARYLQLKQQIKNESGLTQHIIQLDHDGIKQVDYDNNSNTNYGYKFPKTYPNQNVTLATIEDLTAQLDTKLDKAGGTISGSLIIAENLTVQGKTTSVDTQNLKVADKLIYVAKDNTVALTSPAGLITPKYDGTNNGGIVYDHTGTAYVGDITLDSNGNVDVDNSDLQPIATRDTTITDGNIVEWDNTNKTLVDSGKAVDNLSTATNLENGTGQDSIVQKYIVNGTDYSAKASGINSIALGGKRYDKLNDTKQTSTSAEGNQSFAAGGSVHTHGDFAIALGKDTDAYQRASLTAGGGTKAGFTEDEFNAYYWDSTNNVPLHGGQGKNENGEILDWDGKTYSKSYSFAAALGEINYVYGRAAFSSGFRNRVYGKYAGTFGNSNKVNGDNSITGGYNNIVDSWSSIVVGGDNKVSGTYSNVSGTKNTVTNGTSVLVSGNRNNIYDVENSAAIGQLNEIKSNQSFAANYHNYIGTRCFDSAVFGTENTVQDGHANAFVAGKGNKTASYSQSIFGTYNVPNASAVFQIGYGWGEADNERKTAFEVLRSGKVKVKNAPQDSDDVVRKLELDNLNARYVSTSILGG